MLGSINKFILKYPGLSGLPFYFFLISAIATSGSTFGGIGLFYSNMFNAATNSLAGAEILGKEVVIPVLEGAFNLASGALESAEPDVAPALELMFG